MAKRSEVKKRKPSKKSNKLAGAAIGGILGFIGAESIAQSMDGIGEFFSKQFNNLIVAPIKGVWEAVAPDWMREMKWPFQK